MPYVDIVIGNEAEAEAWASANGLPDKTDLAAVGRAIASQTKANASRPRTVVLTHGPKSTTVVTSDNVDNPKVYPVHALSDAEIVDTNGAGDAFAGGFLGGLVLGKSVDECVDAGHKLGSMCVQQVRSSGMALGRKRRQDGADLGTCRLARRTSGPRFLSSERRSPR